MAGAAFCIAPLAFGQNPNNDPALAAEALLNENNHALVMIDHEGQMAFAVQSHTIELLRNMI